MFELKMFHVIENVSGSTGSAFSTRTWIVLATGGPNTSMFVNGLFHLHIVYFLFEVVIQTTIRINQSNRHLLGEEVRRGEGEFSTSCTYHATWTVCNICTNRFRNLNLSDSIIRFAQETIWATEEHSWSTGFVSPGISALQALTFDRISGALICIVAKL